MINILLRNSYPISFIFRTINKRLKYYFNKNDNRKRTKNSNSIMKTFFIIPYLKGVTNKFSATANKVNMSAAFTIPYNLNRFIVTDKDDVNKINKCDVMYRIDYRECEATYVGQIKRQLKTRVNEHIKRQ